MIGIAFATLSPSPPPLSRCAGEGRYRVPLRMAYELATPDRPSPAQRERGGGEGRFAAAWTLY